MVAGAIGATVEAGSLTEHTHEAGTWGRLLGRDHASLVLHQQSTVRSLKHLHPDSGVAGPLLVG